MTQQVVLAIDEGTTNSKAILVSQSGQVLSSGSSPVPTEHPQSGWVQQDPTEIWDATLKAIQACIDNFEQVEIVALGISNQRESILIWDRQTGKALGPVVTWQCRRTAAECDALKAAGHEADVIAKTGLPIDPLFPPTKAAWLLENYGNESDDICVGTVDSWLIWKLTNGQVHATDQSNAARSQFFNLTTLQWDDDLCSLFGVGKNLLPVVHDSSHVFGYTKNAGILPDGVPIASAIGDSHAALFGHGAFNSQDGKATFGTGSSVMATVPEFIVPPNGITSTIAWSINGKTTYAFEGNILVSAAIFPWTANILGIENVTELLDLAQSEDSTLDVVVVPAHVGLGSPHWDPDARGLICNLSFNTGRPHIARAAAESLAFQVQDVFAIMYNAGGGFGQLFVDGGPSENSFLMQLVADLIGHPVVQSKTSETSAMGAAHLAGLAVGFWASMDELFDLAQHEKPITPKMTDANREHKLAVWKNAIAQTTLEM